MYIRERENEYLVEIWNFLFDTFKLIYILLLQKSNIFDARVL